MLQALAISVALATELAQAIASERGLRSAKVYVGALPPNARISAPLPAFRLIGSVVADSRSRPASITLYYELPQNQPDAISAYTSRLMKTGWHESTLPQRFNAMMPQGGFVVVAHVTTMPGVYCSNRGIVAVTRLRAMASVAAIDVGTGQDALRFCTASAMMSAMPSPPPSPPPLPTLQAAQGITMEPAFAPFPGNNSSQAAITTSLPLSTIGTNFAQQLTANGWSGDPAAQSATAYVQTFHMTSKGRHYQSVLSITSTGRPNRYQAAIEEHDIDAKPLDAGGFSFPF